MCPSLTQTVEADGSVVEEVADVAGLWGHGAESVSTAGGEGVDADEQHVHQQRPRVAVRQEVHGGAERKETPQEVPENTSLSYLSMTISSKLSLTFQSCYSWMYPSS